MPVELAELRHARLHCTHATDLLSFALSLAEIFSYQVYLRWRTRRDPASSAQDIVLVARAAWVASVMRECRDILAVQTLRNSTMSASFMASTAILLIIGVLTLSAQGDRLDGLNRRGQARAPGPLQRLIQSRVRP